MSSGGLRPPDPLTRSLAGAQRPLRSRGSLATLIRAVYEMAFSFLAGRPDLPCFCSRHGYRAANLRRYHPARAVGHTTQEALMSRLGRTLGFLVAILALPAAAAAQFPPGPPPLARGTAVIVGQVVDAATGKGISSAIVTLAGSRRAMTTSDGRFAFRALPNGSHSLSAAKSGYIGGAYGMRRPDGATLPVVLADGERRGDIVIWMWRQGSISGSIVDEAGEPVVGIQVAALRRTTVGGRRRFAQSGVGTTDDRGVYRLSRLAPGDYAVGMIASQVSVPAATVRQLEQTVMSGGDAERTRSSRR